MSYLQINKLDQISKYFLYLSLAYWFFSAGVSSVTIWEIMTLRDKIILSIREPLLISAVIFKIFVILVILYDKLKNNNNN